jgi:hypothetical protein
MKGAGWASAAAHTRHAVNSEQRSSVMTDLKADERGSNRRRRQL